MDFKEKLTKTGTKYPQFSDEFIRAALQEIESNSDFSLLDYLGDIGPYDDDGSLRQYCSSVHPLITSTLHTSGENMQHSKL